MDFVEITTIVSIIVWCTLTFLLGAAIGSFLNVVIGRLPLEKSLQWPRSRCMTCYKPLRTRDNIPILGWLRSWGKCRYCGAKFSPRYMFIELFMGLSFAALFFFEVYRNIHHLPYLREGANDMNLGIVPWQSWVYFAHHALLLSFLTAAAICDWDHRSIPLSLTMTGTLVGIGFGVLFPWPFPNDVELIPATTRSWAHGLRPEFLPQGSQMWPFWGPFPQWLTHDARPLYGLLTSLIGAGVGMFIIRSVKFLFEKGLGKEAMGLGDADVMMMAGAFLGWQIVGVAFFMGVLVAIPFGVLNAVRKGDHALPFAPGLAIGIIITWLVWPKLAPAMQNFLFEEILIILLLVVMGGGMFIGSIALRIMGFGAEEPAQGAQPTPPTNA